MKSTGLLALLFFPFGISPSQAENLQPTGVWEATATIHGQTSTIQFESVNDPRQRCVDQHIYYPEHFPARTFVLSENVVWVGSELFSGIPSSSLARMRFGKGPFGQTTAEIVIVGESETYPVVLTQKSETTGHLFYVPIQQSLVMQLFVVEFNGKQWQLAQEADRQLIEGDLYYLQQPGGGKYYSCFSLDRGESLEVIHGDLDSLLRMPYLDFVLQDINDLSGAGLLAGTKGDRVSLVSTSPFQFEMEDLDAYWVGHGHVKTVWTER